MLEQQGNALTFVAFYTESKVAKTGLTVTLDLWEGTSEIVTGGSATEIGDGLYYYTLASGSVDANALYIAVFKTATTTVDQQHIPALWIVGRSWVANVDTTVSSRLAPTTASRTLDVTATGAAGIDLANVENQSTVLALSGTTIKAVTDGVTLTTAGGTAIWNTLTTGNFQASSFGQLFKDNLDATISGIQARVWAYVRRTLTEILVSTNNTNPTNTLATRRGDYYSKSLPGLGNITAYTKLWFDVKETEDGLQPDDDALIQIVVGSGFATTGLIYLNGDTAGSNAWGSLTVDVEATADITIVLEANATVLLPPGRYFYGLKALVAGNPTTLVTGVFIVYPGYTTAVS